MQHSTFSSHQIMQTEIQSTAYIDPRTPLFNLWPSAASNGSAPGREQSTHWLIHSSTVQPTEAPFLHTLEKASQKETKREKMAPKTKSENKNEQNRMFSRNKTHAGEVTDDTSEHWTRHMLERSLMTQVNRETKHGNKTPLVRSLLTAVK